MEINEQLKLNIQNAFNKMGVSLNIKDIVIEASKDPTHGDYATNAAMKFSKLLGKNPRDVATALIGNLDMTLINKIEIAGPGFINFFIKNDSMASIIKRIINEGGEFGRAKKNGQKINVEFVSANPTGDLHVGHARGAAIGDSICRILDFAGYEVTREYYINDAGNQINNLALSLEARYKELLGIPCEFPADGYHGEDVLLVAKEILNKYGKDILSKDNYLAFFKEKGMELELAKIVKDLDNFGVKFDIFSSELKVRSDNAVEKEIDYLSKYTYQEEGAIVLRTTDFLDDKDRVIVKSNGDYTYFLPDIVYHNYKLSRGYDKLIDVLGADHHGYINRMKSALMMHGFDKDVLDIELIQMVRIMQNGVEVKCSKRTGNAYTLRELCEDAGVDAGRYFFAMRAASSHLDFDLDLAREQSSNNPVYYSQYAHARLCSILESGKEFGFDLDGSKLEKNSETALLKMLASFQDVVTVAANERAPYKITNYVHELAEKVHAFYSECRVIDSDNLDVTKSRLALCQAAKIVIKNALRLVGVNAPSHM